MGEDEIGVEEGCMIQLTTGPRGGQNYGDGWWEGQFPPPSYTRLLLASLPTARRVRLPLNVPAYLAALFRRSFVCGKLEGKFYGAVTDELTFCRFRNAHPLDPPHWYSFLP